VRVSRLGLGCAGFGGVGSDAALIGRGEDEATAFALMDHALECGINYFDTANSYGGGTSEAMIGRWLASRRTRAAVFLATKVSTPMGPGVNDGGLSRRHILQHVDASLRRLQTEWIDLYMMHQVDDRTSLEETLRALDDLVHSGKVRYLGACNIESWRLAKSLWISDRLRLARVESVQLEYNLLRRGAEGEIFPLALDQDLAVTPHSPLAGGWLTGKYRAGEDAPPGSRMALRPGPYLQLQNHATFQALNALETQARETGESMSTLALAWVLSHSAVTAALIGPRTLGQIDLALHAHEITFTPAERDRMARQVEEARLGGLG